MTVLEQLHQKIVMNLDLTGTISDEGLTRLIHETISEYGKNHHLSLDEKTALGTELFGTK